MSSFGGSELVPKIFSISNSGAGVGPTGRFTLYLHS